MSDIKTHQYRLCNLYGFDEPRRQHRLMLLHLNLEDAQTMSEIQARIIQPHYQLIMDDFYSFLLQHDDLRKFINNETQIQRLKQTQTEYLLSLGSDFMSAEYFEYRLRVGVAHARIEMPLSSYLIAYNQLELSLYALFDQQRLAVHHYQTLNKILKLDMSLATDAYNLSQTKSMSDSIDHLRHEQHKLANQLMHDTLTGAYSRAYILEQLDKRLAEVRRDSSKQVAVALLDLDKFKNINDNYGHPAGDVVLREFSQAVMQMIRRQDYFGRYGGEEFLLVLVDLNDDSAFELAERIRNTTADKTYEVGNNQLHVTTSIGLTLAQTDEAATTIIERADQALYQAKRSGRNKTVLL